MLKTKEVGVDEFTLVVSGALGILVFTGWQILSQLKRIAESNALSIKCLDAHEILLRKILDENEAISESLSCIQSRLDETESKISNINYVMDVIYKYKLPNKKDRDLLDRIELDNEIFSGIDSARD